MDGRRWPVVRCALIGAGVCASAPNPASAQVMEIGPAGVRVISGPVVVTDGGAVPIRPTERKPDAHPRHAAAAPLLERAGQAADLSPRLIEAVAYVESRFNAGAVSPKGAVGMMQLMPETARDLGVDAADPDENVHGGADYLRRMLVMFDNNVELAVAAYNAGPGAVRKYGGVPPFKETRAYVDAVMDYLAKASVSEAESSFGE